MKKLVFIFTIIFFRMVVSFCQPLNKLFIDDKILSINIINNIAYKVEKTRDYRENNSCICYADTNIIDTIILTNNIFRDGYFNEDNFMIYNTKKEYDTIYIYKWNIMEMSLEVDKRVDLNTFSFNGSKLLYGIQEESPTFNSKQHAGNFPILPPVRTINYCDLKTNKIDELFSLSKTEGEFIGIIDVLPLNLNKLLISYGKKNSDETIEECKYLIYDCNNDSYAYFDNSEKPYNYIFPSVGINNYWIDYKNNIYIRNFILDEKLNLFGESLQNRISAKGFFIEDNLVKGYFIQSETDSKKNRFKYENVIIYYPKNATLDIAFKKVYDNKKLTSEDLLKFSHLELELIKNMIFAKYNFMFEDEYFQAFFNQFDFYNYRKGDRLQNIDSLLSDVDNENLNLLLKSR